MSSAMKFLRHPVIAWGLRALLVAAVAWILAGQISWHDEVVLKEGGSLQGRWLGEAAEGWRWELLDGSERRVLASEVALRAQADPPQPDIRFGLRTLGGRLAKDPLRLTLVLLGFFLIVVLIGWRWHALLSAICPGVGWLHAVRLTYIGGFFNLVLPGSTGGDVVRAFYGARDTGQTTRAVLSVFVDRFIGVFMLLVVSAIALWLAVDHPRLEQARWFVLALILAALFGASLLASPRLRRGLGLAWILRKLPFDRIKSELNASVTLYRERLGALTLAVGISLVNQSGIAACVWLLAGALGIDGVTLPLALALVPLANLAAAVPLVPGGWGVGELAFAWLFGQAGVPATEAVALSVVFRLSWLVVNLPGGLFWIFFRGQASHDKIAATVEEAAEHVADLESVEANSSTPAPTTPDPEFR